MEGQTSKPQGFIQFNRFSDVTIHRFPLAFNLLTVIARRAKRTENYVNVDLSIGDALIGDFENYGMTRGEYRQAVKKLVKLKLITTKTTNKGTIARLIDTSIFDINADKTTTDTANKQPAEDQRATTNNNDNNGKNDKQLLSVSKVNDEHVRREMSKSEQVDSVHVHVGDIEHARRELASLGVDATAIKNRLYVKGQIISNPESYVLGVKKKQAEQQSYSNTIQQDLPIATLEGISYD